jgi:phosphoglycolate phosphatase
MLHIIWDMDGTLIDSEKELKQAIEIAVKETGLDLTKQIKPFIVGPTIDKILRESFPSDIMTNDLLNKIIIAFRNIYDNSNFEQTKPYPGLENIIFDTTNFIHYIVTNKPDMPTNRILNKFNWSKYIARILTPYSNFNLNNSGNKKRSKPDLFMDILTESGADTSSFIVIGDMKTDCLAAKDNKITAIGVLWGSGTREELSGCCDYLFEDTKQLHDFLYDISNHKKSV